jgi:Carboxypeptidase regulatory-like domain
MQGIAPGDYRIFAWESIPDGAWENAEYLAPFERFGRIVRITPGVSAIAAVDWIPKTSSPAPTSSAPSAPDIPVADANGRAIEGTVTNAADGKPIGGARVLLFPSATIRTTTDENGRFLLTGFPEGKHDVVVQHDAYLGPLTNGSYSSGATLSTTVDARKPRVKLDFTLYPAGTASGRILDQNGKLASRLVVDLVNLTTPSRNGRARTDDRGEFHVLGLVPGQYLVAVQQELGIPSAASQSSVVRTYYPGSVDSSRALPVTIGLGSDIRNLDFQIQTASTVSISGKITTDLGVEIPAGLRIGLNVLAISNDANAANPNPVHIGSVDQKTGEFEVRGLQPGSYTVLSRIQAPGISLAGVANVDVGFQDVGGVQLLVR